MNYKLFNVVIERNFNIQKQSIFVIEYSEYLEYSVNRDNSKNKQTKNHHNNKQLIAPQIRDAFVYSTILSTT